LTYRGYKNNPITNYDFLGQKLVHFIINPWSCVHIFKSNLENMSQTSVGWPNVGVFHKSCPKQRASYLLESTSDGIKTAPRFWCGFEVFRNPDALFHMLGQNSLKDDCFRQQLGTLINCPLPNTQMPLAQSLQ